MFALLVVFVIIAFTAYLYKLNKLKPKNFPPGPPLLPLWGSYWFMLKENYFHAHLALEKLAQKYKTDILGLYLGTDPAVVTFNIDLCKELLTRDEFIGRPETIITKGRGLGDNRGIFFVEQSLWKEERRFTLRHMRDFGFGRRSEIVENFVIDEVKYLIDTLNEENPAQSDICRGKGQFLFPDLLYGSLLNTIFLILSATRFDNKKLREVSRTALIFQRTGDVTGNAISMTPWLQYIAPNVFGPSKAFASNKYLLDFLREIIDDHLKTISEDHSRDFIDDYIIENTKNGAELDYNQLLLVTLDYMFPATIAIGHTLSFYFAYLINNPHVQIKIQNEIKTITGNSRLPNLDDRKNMPYLEASIRESVRLFPINPLGIPRRCLQDTTLGGYFIPKDTVMLPCVWTAHRDPKIWTNPLEFIPERFLDENGELIKKDVTLGFGGGRRLCAGETYARQNMFLIVAGLLQNFTFKSPTGEPIDFNDIVPGVNLSFRENWILAVPN